LLIHCTRARERFLITKAMSNIGNRERRNARRCLKEESLKVKNLLDKVLDLPSEIIGILWRSAIDIKSSI
jgi:hypothetical protein